jgi:hypothetical protein
MQPNHRQLLQQLAEGGGETTEYEFVEYGLVDALQLFVAEGLVERIPTPHDFATVRITQGGLDFLAGAKTPVPSSAGEISEAQAVHAAQARLSKTKLAVGAVVKTIYKAPTGRRAATYQVWFAYAGPPIPPEQRNRTPPADHPTVIIVNAKTGKCSFLPWR